MNKIFITGGHFAPAKAVVQELLRRGDWEIYYLGRKSAMEGSTSLALEYTEMPKLPVKYLTITTGRVQRQFFVNVTQSIFSLFKIFIGLGQTLFWLVKYRPNVVLSFGSYVAIPVVFWAWLLGIPILTHEQTTVSGRSNKLISYLSDKVLVSWPESLAHFPQNKVVLTGNPLREEILNQKLVRQLADQQPVVYITGGSQGSKAIDQVVAKVSPRLSKKYQLVVGRLTGEESAQALARADLVVSRAGANTVTEILALEKPAILIPLPHTFSHEQEKNAKLVVDVGLGEILEQKSLTAQKLIALIDKVLSNKQKYLANASKAKKLINPEAAKLVVDEVEKLI